MIDRNHPAVTRWFPNGNVNTHIRLAESFAEAIRGALPLLAADDLRDTPAGRALMAEAWEEGALHQARGSAETRRVLASALPNPYKETP